MKPQTAKRLLDARNAALEILDFTSGKHIEDMWRDRSLQLSLHKLLEIVGEALNQASRFDPETAAAIPNLRRFVDLRNQITHGYDSVDYAIVWQVATERIPPLITVLERLLEQAPPVPETD
jgi:uncharacterized protein with HEPN domain